MSPSKTSDVRFPAVMAMALFFVMAGVRLSAGSTPVVPKLPQGQVILSPSTNNQILVFPSDTRNINGSQYGLTNFPLQSAITGNYSWTFEPLIPGVPYCHMTSKGKSCTNVSDTGMFAFSPVHPPKGEKLKYCLDIQNASVANGKPVIAYPCHYRSNQRFNVLAGCGSKAGLLFLKAQNSGKCLKYDNKTGLVVQWACNEMDVMQLWQFYGNTTFSGGLKGCPSPPPSPPTPPPPRPPRPPPPSPKVLPPASRPPPPSPQVSYSSGINWLAAGRVSPARSEGSCSRSQWSIVAVAATESALAIKYKKAPQQLSVELLVACTSSWYNDGCYGGDAAEAFLSMSQFSIPTEGAYPFLSSISGSAATCQTNWMAMPMTDLSWFQGGADYIVVADALAGARKPATELQIITALQTQPLAVAFNVSMLYYYTSGILTTYEDPESGCSSDPYDSDSYLLLVGYVPAASGNKAYWILQNTWGTSWGEGGYVRVALNGQANGPCGMHTYVLAASMNFKRVPAYYTVANYKAPPSPPPPRPPPPLVCDPVPSGYTFMPGYDANGNDLQNVPPVKDAAMACDANPQCVAFNTDGWLKWVLVNLGKFDAHFSATPCLGIYVKNLSPPPVRSPSPAPPPPLCTYTVLPGDTCCTIAKAKSTCLDTLVKLNPWIETFTAAKCANVQPGMSLIIPCTPDKCTGGTPATCATNCTYTVKSGDTCGCIAKTLGINTATLYGFNTWLDSRPLTKCSNIQVDSQLNYPCKASSTQATGTDSDAKCPLPSPPTPPCYGNQCAGPDTPCIPDNSTALLGNPSCAQLLSVYGLPGACYDIVTGKAGVPFQCPCMCAGICSNGSCGDGVCGVAAKCATCKCSTKSSPSPVPPAPPLPTIVPNCSTGDMYKNVYFSSPSITVRSGMCITVNSSKVLNLQSCSKKSSVTDTFTLSPGFPSGWFTITNVKTGLCVDLNKTVVTQTSMQPDGSETTCSNSKLRAVLNPCSTADSQLWMYSYYLGLLQSKSGYFLSPAGDSMNPGTTLAGSPFTNKNDTAYGSFTRSWIVWPTNGPTCGFTGAVVSLASDNVDRKALSVANVTWPAPQGVSPVGATVAGVVPTNLKTCLDATTIQVFRGTVQGMVSFLPCVAGKASQYVQSVSYKSMDWAVSTIGNASFGVTNAPSGWPEGHFFLTFPKVKPDMCFDIYMAQGLDVAIIHYKCHPSFYPGNQLWSVDWTRGYIRNVIPSSVNIWKGEQGKAGDPVCAHFEKSSMNVFSGNCSGDDATNKFLWWPMPNDQTRYQQNYANLQALG